MKHAIDSAPHSRIWHHRDLLPQTVLLTAAVFTTAAAPYIGALVSSALIIIFPLRYFRTLSTSACAGIVFTIASKEVGIDLSDDFARYYDIYKQFVENNPYRFWKLIKIDNEILGSFYITFENSIGINLIKAEYNLYLEIIKKILIEYKPLKETKSLRSKYFIFNTNPKNNLLIKALKKIGTEHIQNTYAIKN